jgi:hypothetical protein
MLEVIFLLSFYFPKIDVAFIYIYIYIYRHTHVKRDGANQD